MVVIVFPDRATADAALREIAATPDLEGGTGPVWVWFDPDADTNQVTYAASVDGRVAIAHPWSEVDEDWLAAYLADWTDVVVTDALPADWQWPAD